MAMPFRRRGCASIGRVPTPDIIPPNKSNSLFKEDDVKRLLGVVLIPLAAVACNPFAARIYTIPPCALDHWVSYTIAFPHNRYETEFCFTTVGSAEDIVTIAPVNLPNGVTVKKLTTFLTDNTDRDEARMMIILGRHNLHTGAREQIAQISTRG
jgi:hypothetical protein